ncbi:DEAD/DEAH box helicase [Nicoliella spurrieriana]|uniref:DEAD/DEAH box helicase n=1 Tax=Nicoliella spurrieriana TaxID=2925830 RepID=A0A976RR76_9LACO|nr:DEAD/DEAH box helicase [Nicoliella spurrieriana]UQS86397.1 DEAD/DEAH box helicase [Nicoliella spurrieriana]
MKTNFAQHFTQLGFDQLTPIQEQVYQPIIDGQSIVGLSPTGSGKTVAFTIPIIEQLMPREGTQVLILEPSQELAMQTTSVMRDWAKLNDAKVLALTGGANVKRQIEKLKKRPEVVVGTPGRVLNLLDDHKLKLHHLKTVVIDEADDLLQDTTLSSVREILNQGPSDVQLTFFSATDTEILHSLKKWFNVEPQLIDVRKIDHSAGEVKHRLLNVSRGKRNQMLNRLTHINGFKALVFFDQLLDLNRAYSFFRHNHVNNVASLTSNMNQMQRQRAITGFRKGHYKLLLTTDVAARGLDIAKLPAVVNFDLPNEANQYVHRVGRTGRMGEPGLVINFGNDHDFRDLKRLVLDNGYDLEPTFFYKNQLVDHVPAQKPGHANKATQSVKSVESIANDKADSRSKTTVEKEKKVAKSDQNVTHKALVNTPLPDSAHPTKKQMKRRNKKHLKNKGMRKKWRNANK